MQQSKYWIAVFCAFFLLTPVAWAQNKPLSTLELLQSLIRINTTNPPGNEIEAVHFVKEYLKNFGIDSKIIESAPGRGNLIARLKGDGNKKPLMLLAHLDVVTADPSEWTYPPFEPEVHDGYLYGRGAMDMKGQAALMIQAFIKLKQKQIPLEGDVLLVLVADEEAGGKYGAEFLVENHWEELKPGLVINEGSIGFQYQGLRLYPIQVAEKGVAWLKLTTTGTSGHGSLPTPDNATVKLIKALDRLVAKPQPIQKTPIAEAFLDGLAKQFSFPKSFFIRNFFTFPMKQLTEKKLTSNKIFNAMVRNTIVPTVLKAGTKTNVIPAQATAEVDCRILPGETPQAFRKKVEEIIQDPQVQVELITESLPNESNFQTPYFKAFAKAIQQQDPQAIVVPFISPGATDNRFFRAKGVLAYGIIPFVITPEDLKGLHGKDERIPVAEIAKAERILFNLVKEVQGK